MPRIAARHEEGILRGDGQREFERFAEALGGIGPAQVDVDRVQVRRADLAGVEGDIHARGQQSLTTVLATERLLDAVLERGAILHAQACRDGGQGGLLRGGGRVDADRRIDATGGEHRRERLPQQDRQRLCQRIVAAGRQGLIKHDLGVLAGGRWHRLHQMRTDRGTFAIGGRRHRHGRLPLVGAFHGLCHWGARNRHGAVLDEEPILLAVDRDAQRQRLGVGEAVERGSECTAIQLLALLACSGRALFDQHAELLAERVWQQVGKQLDAERVVFRERGKQRRGIDRLHVDALRRYDRPAILLHQVEGDAIREREAAGIARLLGGAGDGLERIEQLVEALDRHEAVHGDVVAIGCQHRAQRPLRIEPG